MANFVPVTESFLFPGTVKQGDTIKVELTVNGEKVFTLDKTLDDAPEADGKLLGMLTLFKE